MSATRDKTQKIAFVYTSLYQVFKKGREDALAPALPESGKVLKAGTQGAPNLAGIQIRKYTPIDLLAKRVPAQAAPSQPSPQKQTLPELAPAQSPVHAQGEAIRSLKENLKSLNDLHSRLRFMLKELEDLVKE